MANPTQERFCPFCEQIIPRDQDFVIVGKNPFPVKMFHIGCAERIVEAYKKYLHTSDSSDES